MTQGKQLNVTSELQFSLVQQYWHHYCCNDTIFLFTVKSLIQGHQIPKLKCISCHLAVALAQCIEAKYQVENEDVVGAALTGDAPTTSEWSKNLLPTKVSLIRGLVVFIYCINHVLWQTLKCQLHLFTEHLIVMVPARVRTLGCIILAIISIHSDFTWTL